jgi:hypothetical protein
MTKLETVRALNDSGPQLQIVESVRTLQQSVSLMHEDLKRLPGAVSTETAQTLEPLARLRQDVTQVLEAYDKVTAIQRNVLEELTHHMSVSAAQAFEQKAGKLDATISDLSRSLAELKTSLSSMEQTAQQVATLPGKLTSAQQSMTKAAYQLTEAANETRPSFWRQALGLILAGAVGAGLIATGHIVLNRLVPPSDVQETADWANAIWSKATDKERQLLKQIVNRPAK